MSQQHVDAFRRVGDAINHGDVDAVLAETHAEFVFEPQRAATEGAYVGHDGVRRWLADTAATFELFRVEYPDVRNLGDCVLAIGTIRVRGRESGVETDVPTAFIVEFRDGLCWRAVDYREARLALEAAGLSE